MSDLRKDLPSAKADNFPQRTREVLMTYMGRQGNPLDRGLTLRDLIENGLAEFPPGYTPRPGGGTPPLVPGPSIPSPEVDLTPPPTPTGFSVDAAISHIFIEHDAPTYRQGHGHLRTRVYGATWTSGDLPVFADAIEITQFSGTTFAHPTNPSTTWHLWIKWETKDGVLSADPAGGANGLVAITGQNVGLLLDALDGELNESQLTQGLRSRIELIDGPSSTPGTVAQRVLAEQTARSTADDALSSSISTLGTTVNNNYNTLNSAIQAETSARSTAISTEANARQTLQSRVESIDSTLTAAVQTEASTRASETGSLFAKYTIKVDVNGYVSGFGLASTSNNGVPTSEFTVIADKFTFAPVQTDNTANDGAPFFHRTTATTINGASVPAGTYMKAAYIHDATITNAKIADLAVDNAKIANLSASKLTAGSISVGQHIQSSGFVSGNSGWRINGDGTAEFANAIVRGTVYGGSIVAGSVTADKIDTRGLTIKDLAGNVLLGSGSGLPTSYIAPNSNENLISDDGFYDPRWWFGDQNLTSWSYWIYAVDGTVAGQPKRFLRLSRPTTTTAYSNASTGTFDFSSVQVPIRQGGKYVVRLRMFLSPDFAGNIAPVVHFPSVDWALPGDPGKPIASRFVNGLQPDTSVRQHNATTWGTGGWREFEFVVTADNPACNKINTRILGKIDAGYAEIYMSVQPLLGNGVQIDNANVSTYIADTAIGNAQIANAAITTAKIGDAAITTAKIGDAAITTAKIGDAAITNAKIQDAAITSAKIENLAVNQFKLANQSVSVQASASGINNCATTITIPSGAVGTIVAAVSNLGNFLVHPILAELKVSISPWESSSVILYPIEMIGAYSGFIRYDSTTHINAFPNKGPGTYTVTASITADSLPGERLVLVVFATWK